MKERQSYYAARLKRALGGAEFERVKKLYEDASGYRIKPIGENEIKFYKAYYKKQISLTEARKKMGFKTNTEVMNRFGRIVAWCVENGSKTN